MRLSRSVIPVVVSLGLLALLTAFPATVASAQNGTTGAPTPTTGSSTGTATGGPTATTPQTTTTTGASGGQTSSDRGDGPWIGALLFGFAIAVALLVYMRLAEKDFFKTQRLSLKRTGQALDREDVAPLVESAFLTVPGEDELTVDGPVDLTVGTEAQYSVKASTDGATLTEVVWSVVPADAATLTSVEGSATTMLTPKVAGALAIHVSAMVNNAGPPSKGTGIKTVTAAEATGKLTTLPFIGVGYGTLVLAIVLLTLVAVLGLNDVLSGDVVATLFGTLAGYIFVKTASDSSADTPNANSSGADSTK